MVLGLIALLAAAETPDEASWPLYRLAMSTEGLREALGEPPIYRWARGSRGQLGLEAPTGTPSQLEEELTRLERFEALAALRWHIRLGGPPSVERLEKSTRRFSRPACSATWEVAEVGGDGLYTAIAGWPERPACVLQRLPEDPKWGYGDEPIDVSIRSVGEGWSRVAARASKKDFGFRALHDGDGRLSSAAVWTPTGLASITRQSAGVVVLERRLSSEVVAVRLAFPRALASGARSIDLSVSEPVRPEVPAALAPIIPAASTFDDELMCTVFHEGPSYLSPNGRMEGPSTPSFTFHGSWKMKGGDLVVSGSITTPEGTRDWKNRLHDMQVWRRGDTVFVAGKKQSYNCSAGGTMFKDLPVYPWVKVEDAGAGPEAVKLAREVASMTIGALYQRPPADVLVVSKGTVELGLQHIEIAYGRGWGEAAEQLRHSMQLAMPWQAVTADPRGGLDAPIVVTVGW